MTWQFKWWWKRPGTSRVHRYSVLPTDRTLETDIRHSKGCCDCVLPHRRDASYFGWYPLRCCRTSRLYGHELPGRLRSEEGDFGNGRAFYAHADCGNNTLANSYDNTTKWYNVRNLYGSVRVVFERRSLTHSRTLTQLVTLSYYSLVILP